MKKRLSSLFLSLVFIFTAIGPINIASAVDTYTDTETGLIYTLSNSKATVVGTTDLTADSAKTGDLELPFEFVNAYNESVTYPLVAVAADFAFGENDNRYLTFKLETDDSKYSDEFTTIIEIAESGKSPFGGYIVVPASVTTIGTYAFSSPDVTGVNLGKSGVSAIPDGCFKGCSKLSTVILNNTIAGSGAVDAIGQNAFAGCGDVTLTIPGNCYFSCANWPRGALPHCNLALDGSSTMLECNFCDGRPAYIYRRLYVGGECVLLYVNPCYSSRELKLTDDFVGIEDNCLCNSSVTSIKFPRRLFSDPVFLTRALDLVENCGVRELDFSLCEDTSLAPLNFDATWAGLERLIVPTFTTAISSVADAGVVGLKVCDLSTVVFPAGLRKIELDALLPNEAAVLRNPVVIPHSATNLHSDNAENFSINVDGNYLFVPYVDDWNTFGETSSGVVAYKVEYDEHGAILKDDNGNVCVKIVATSANINRPLYADSMGVGYRITGLADDVTGVVFSDTHECDYKYDTSSGLNCAFCGDTVSLSRGRQVMIVRTANDFIYNFDDGNEEPAPVEYTTFFTNNGFDLLSRSSEETETNNSGQEGDIAADPVSPVVSQGDDTTVSPKEPEVYYNYNYEKDTFELKMKLKSARNNNYGDFVVKVNGSIISPSYINNIDVKTLDSLEEYRIPTDASVTYSIPTTDEITYISIECPYDADMAGTLGSANYQKPAETIFAHKWTKLPKLNLEGGN